MTATTEAEPEERPAPSRVETFLLHPSTRIALRWLVIVALAAFAFSKSIESLYVTTLDGGLNGYVWMVPLAGILAVQGVARRERTELPIHDRQTDLIVGTMGLVFSLLLHGVLLQRYALYYHLLRLDLLALWVFVISASIVLFGLRPIGRFYGVWILLSLIFTLPYHILVILLGGNRIAAGAVTLIVAGAATSLSVGRTWSRGWLGGAIAWVVGLSVLAFMAIYYPYAPVLAFQMVPALTATALVGFSMFLVARRGGPKRVLDRKVQPLAATQVLAGLPLIVVIAILLSLVRLPVPPIVPPLTFSALEITGPLNPPAGWQITETRDYPWVKRLHGRISHLTRQRMVADVGNPEWDKLGRPRTVMVDNVITDRPYSFNVYPAKVLYDVSATRLSKPEPVDLGYGVQGDVVSVVDDHLLVTWNMLQWTWRNDTRAQRVLVISVDNHDDDAPFPEPVGALLPTLSTLFTVLFRGNSAVDDRVLYLVWDDTGIATWDCFGGLVEMPAMTRLAERGVRLSQFHTTALCSPTRASLLTGRNATTVGMATIEEFTDGFPNCNGRIPADTALLSEVLAERGWNTYCVGKWHLTPLEESNLAATKRHWPLSRGFERFYGFMGGETDQWYPDLVYDNHPVAPPATPEDGYHLSKDLADKTIEFIRDAKVIAPDKPWFSYVCPGAGHAPHHVFTEWADKYAGKFDMGYEAYRDIVLANQKKLGIVPPDTELSPVNPYLDVTGPNGEPWPFQDTVRPWDSLNDEEKRLFSRMAEVFAGFLSYTDAQIGRILDYLEESGQLDNTIIVTISDNGASGEGGPNGSVNEVKFFNGYIDTVEESMRFFDHLGGPDTYNHYPIGWAMAFNTPYKLFKRYASHEGGIADTAIISWPKGIKAHGEVRDNYVNVCDVTPTIYDLLGIEPPAEVGGIAQKPLDGVSFKGALDDANAATGKTTQFYTMLGTRGIWHDGWFANTLHAATPSGWSNFDKDRWELFHIASDRSQCHDLAAEHPEKLEELKALWFAEAEKYNGLPLSDFNIFETMSRSRPYLVADRKNFTYYPDNAEVGLGAAPELRGASFSVLAELTVDTTGAEGVLYKQGAGHGGHVLFVQDGRLHYIYNFMGEDEQRVSSPDPIPLGEHVFGVRWDRTGTVEGSHTPLGTASLYIDGAVVAARENVRTHPAMFGISGGGVSVGRNTSQAVSSAYKAPYPFTGGTIAKVVVDISGTPYVDVERELARAFAKD